MSIRFESKGFSKGQYFLVLGENKTIYRHVQNNVELFL